MDETKTGWFRWIAPNIQYLFWTVAKPHLVWIATQ